MTKVSIGLRHTLHGHEYNIVLSANYWLLSSGRQLVRVAALMVEEAGYKISLPQNPGQKFMVKMVDPITDGMSDSLGMKVLCFKLG